jgi:hypothetical protein
MDFDIGRLRRSDRIIGISAIALFIVLFFFKWYGVSTNVGLAGAGINLNVSKSGWDVFTNSRWIWLLTIIVALGAVAVASGALKLKSPVQPGVLVAGLGALSTLLILYRIVHHPSGGGAGYSYGIKIGIWLGLIAAAVLTYGGYLGMQAEGTSLADVREQASDAISNLSASTAGSQSSPPPPASGASESGTPPMAPPTSSPAVDPPADPPPSL